MKKVFAMAVPIPEGKTERWKEFIDTLNGKKNTEFKASRASLGIRERTFLQETPMGNLAVVTLEGENPEEAFKKFGQGKDAFTKWFVQEVKDIHGMDLSAPPQGKLPELLIDSGELTTTGRKPGRSTI